MAIIVDRRNNKSSKNSSNRDRFIKRYKRYIKKSLDETIKDKKITDSDNNIDIIINRDTVTEQYIDFDRSTGDHGKIIPGNDSWDTGDFIPKDNEYDSKNNKGDGEEEDQFIFTLSKEEFFDLYFDDFELPDFIKESMLETIKFQYQRSGYTKDGIPARLDTLKTLSMSIARRISSKNSDKTPPWLDDIDLRYKYYTNIPKPMLKAVMFCTMDVSGSMTEHHKYLSKKFFILLYWFLKKNYETVEVRFIRYHSKAQDVDEETFFYSQETGGTNVVSAYKLINEIIDMEYPKNIYNIYLAHTSDGDYYEESENEILNFIDDELISKLQYYAYVQMQTSEEYSMFKEGWVKLYGLLENSINCGKKLNIETATAPVDIYPVLANLFKKGNRNG